jgi:hypothetical protein
MDYCLEPRLRKAHSCLLKNFFGKQVSGQKQVGDDHNDLNIY